MNMSIPNSVIWLGEKLGEAAADDPRVAGCMLAGGVLMGIIGAIWSWRRNRKAKK